MPWYDDPNPASSRMELRTITTALLYGWVEEVDVRRVVRDCTDECEARKLTLTIGELRHYTCRCPATVEISHARRRESPLLTQLLDAHYHVPVTGERAGKTEMIHSPTPGNLLGPDESLAQINDVAVGYAKLFGWIYRTESRDGATELALRYLAGVAIAPRFTPQEIAPAAMELRQVAVRAAGRLGHRAKWTYLEEEACPECGGALRYADPIVIECGGRANVSGPCGGVWPWYRWALLSPPVGQSIDLLTPTLAEPGRPSTPGRLVDSEAAALWIGRDRHTLYRWHAEGRITRHGTRRAALWDLAELPPAGSPPPPVRPSHGAV